MTDQQQPPIRPGQPLPYPASAMPPLDDAPAAPCPGYVPTTKTCERCGRAPWDHSHREAPEQQKEA